MRWVPDVRCWRFRRRPDAVAAILGQLTQASTIVAILNAVVLLVGWKIDPGKVEALGTVLSVLDAVMLAVLQEAPPPPPPASPGGSP